MKLICFSKCLKFNSDSKSAIKLQQIVFGFSNNCICTASGKFSFLRREYSPSAVNILIETFIK